MRNVMGKEEKKASASELLRELHQRSGSRCEGYKLGLDCVVKLTEDLEPLIHHIAGNPRNNEISNLVLLCPSCHSEVMDLLSEKRRKTYVKKVVEGLDKSSFGNRHS
jgi:5-methylcytosine-specific restriction endonuclease McrA